MNYKIVVDSSANMTKYEGLPFAYVPLKIQAGETEYTDGAELNVENMVREIQAYKGKTGTACPNSAQWIEAFGDAERIFCITITSNLSGCYNSAMIAKREYEEMHRGREVFVVDTLSTGPEMELLVEKIRDLIDSGESYETICKKIPEYLKITRLLFSLESLKNLARNGRVHPAVAHFAGLIGIRVVGKASDEGTLEPLHKCRGEKSALTQLFNSMKQMGYNGGKVRLAHCLNEKAAHTLKEKIQSTFANADVRISNTLGLCAYYAEEGGLLIGFETGI